ncbi:MAG: ribose 5-phosphate isomerase B [Deltaproteobacteria bacterium]|nr:MAG: ribose 5-phosphate isomerase B [Deltaproteobacteria bacterium]
MKVSVGSDHGGLDLKAVLVAHLEQRGHEVVDLGTHTPSSCDYPEFARAVAERVRDGEADRGVLVCGTGIGMSIAANKVRGIRAAVVSDPFSARMASEHNDARVLCFGQRTLGPSVATLCLDAWLDATFEGGRHARRVDGITAIEVERD